MGDEATPALGHGGVDRGGSALTLAREKSEMVPGMTERERLAADMQRLEWLADATFGPTHLPRPPSPPAVPTGTRHSLPLGFCIRDGALVHVLRRHIRAIRLRSAWPAPREATGHPIAE